MPDRLVHFARLLASFINLLLHFSNDSPCDPPYGDNVFVMEDSRLQKPFG